MPPHDLMVYVAVAFAVFVAAGTAASRRADAARLALLEKKVDQLLSQAGLDTDAYLQSSAGNPASAFSAAVPMAGTASADIMNLIRRGRKIEAIKLYREQNPGTDLKHAKDAVEQIERDLR